MTRFKTIFCTVLISLVSLAEARAFSLIGPFPAWQTQRIGYQLGSLDIGGPMALGEEYRLTTSQISYGFTPEFVNWFGQSGIEETDKAIKIFQDLGDLSVIDPNAFPLTSSRFHASAYQLNLVDLKSTIAFMMTEFMGLTDPQQYVYTLRSLTVIQDPIRQYNVINRNYDPITYEPSTSINGHVFTYTTIFDNDTVAFPIISAVDPLAELATSVASKISGDFQGTYVSSLTRDDVGGLKYLYRRDNYNVQTLPTGSTLATTGGSGVSRLDGSSTPWTPVLPNLTNQVTTVNTNIIDRGLRGGLGKVDFIKVQYDSTFGDFIPVVIREQDVIITNGVPVRQVIERTLVTAPDLTIGLMTDESAVIGDRGGSFTSFDPISAVAGDDGPGAINTPHGFQINRREPTWSNLSPFALDKDAADELVRIGSYDGSRPNPIIYPSRSSIAYLESLVNSAASGQNAGAWTPIIGAPITDPNATTQNTTP